MVSVIGEIYYGGKVLVAVYDCVSSHAPEKQLRRGIKRLNNGSAIAKERHIPMKDKEEFLVTAKILREDYKSLLTQPKIARDPTKPFFTGKVEELGQRIARFKAALKLNLKATEFAQSVRQSSDYNLADRNIDELFHQVHDSDEAVEQLVLTDLLTVDDLNLEHALHHRKSAPSLHEFAEHADEAIHEDNDSDSSTVFDGSSTAFYSVSSLSLSG
ncbi:hypothetical protein C8R46DRAFT_1360355 [Mycena filopes]|nr:hypothetical protein C8R46DRAFT_1360355 [Mycena filopes]